ncbi:hypothetical protein KP509_14G071900 [Ceratopteris richardii]|nr:hypothetical protein KP509_14G071900 [Ceratopteris richardii]KAH7416027.1 hypothetical protein KP509_14G071900 [Ceratopteris richardii]
MRIRHDSEENLQGVESGQNLKFVKIRSCHIRHSSLDSVHPSALHPINLNSNFSPPSPPSKSTITDQSTITLQTNNENRCSFNANNQTEDAGGTQKELIHEPDESFFQDPEEGHSFYGNSGTTSISAESPRENPDPFKRSDTTFSSSETNGSPTCSSAVDLYERTERPFEGNTHANLCSQLSGNEHPQVQTRNQTLPVISAIRGDVLPVRRESSVQSTNHVQKPSESVLHDGSGEIIMSNPSKCEYSVRSTSYLQNPLENFCNNDSAQLTTHKPPMSFEAQNCHTHSNAQVVEASLPSEDRICNDQLRDADCCSTSDGKKNYEEVENCSQHATQIGGSSFSEGIGELQDDLPVVSEEVKIRAELELEIERDLEQEIKTKIYLLNRRLEELQVLKATRHPKQDHIWTEMEREIAKLLKKDKREIQILKSPPDKSPESRRSSETVVSTYVEDRTPMHANAILTKKELVNVERDELNSNPFASLRKFVELTSHRSHSSKLPFSDRTSRDIKIPKDSAEAFLLAAKPKLQADNLAYSKPHHQNWTAAASEKNWTRTLRSNMDYLPRLPTVRANFQTASSSSLHPKDSAGGNVARALLAEEDASGPIKNLSRTKTRGNMMASSTEYPKEVTDNAISLVNAKKIASHHVSTHSDITYESQEGRISNPTVSRPPVQQYLGRGKLGKTEKPVTLVPPISPTFSLRDNPPSPAEKAERSISAPPRVTVRSTSSKESKATQTKVIHKKHVSPLPHGREAREAPSEKAAASSSHATNKGKMAMHRESLGRRPAASYSRPTAASIAKGMSHQKP